KGFLRGNLYHHPDLDRPRRRAKALIADLFRYYEEDPAKLPPPHFDRIGERGVQRVVCDYIAGMTDSFARKIRGRISSRTR
ncbi:MAG: deoxyguanosinetriphosphate triphosphohydrolase, partial [Candidatus Aminicenantes bacterium]|nr:deoxyguanosinetriphosphate triphosphohydrolase [Candidatus Aminicenantes bacterium]